MERRSSLLPCINQIVLTFMTLLFFASTLIFTFVAIKFRLFASLNLLPATCTVTDVSSQLNTTCFYKSPIEEIKYTSFPCLQVRVNVVREDSDEVKNLKLLMQSDTKIYGDDHIRRPCSFLPDKCAEDETSLADQARAFAQELGENGTFPCFDVADLENHRITVMTSQTADSNVVMMALVVPLGGALLSLLCCFEFWRRNYRHVSRLYVYNSWSAS